jgi:mersacidin/lichenicidin family type 2 lantibiotic
MKIEQIIKAWKDPTYRASLSEQERAQLPENPAGVVELNDAQLGDVNGAAKPSVLCTSPVLCGSASIICASSICRTHLTCGGGICGPIVMK